MLEHYEMRQLSLTARLCIGLLVFKRLADATQLDSSEIDDFLDYLWQIPTLEGDGDLPSWDARRPPLMDFGFGGRLSADIHNSLERSGLTESEFRELVESLVEIVHSSMYGASDEAGSAAYLKTLVKIARDYSITPPPIEGFLDSRFADRQGWGAPQPPGTRDLWRKLAW